jgi:hypothetical protein
MSFLPTFLSWQSAAIAAALAIPALLLLYFLKLRRKQHDIASTFLWKKSVQDLQVNSPFQRLRRNLLLLLQALVLLAILLAYARPVSFQTIKPGAMNIILIDRSGSMQTKDVDGASRFEAARKKAREIIDAMPRDARAAIIAFDASAEVVQPFSTDRVVLRRAVESITPTDGPTRLQTALQLADAAMAIDPAQLRAGTQAADIYILSDGRVRDADALSTLGTVRYIPIGHPQTPNLAIVAMSARRNYESPTDVQVFARLANFGPEPVRADVVLSISPIDPATPGVDRFVTQQVRQTAQILPARWTEDQRREAEKSGLTARDSVEFRVELTTAAVIRIEHKISSGSATNASDVTDALSIDDIAHVVVPPPKPLSIALVTEGNYFLERAVSSLGAADLKIISPGEYERNVPTTHDVIFFDRITPSQLPDTGAFVYFGCLPPGTPVTQQADVQSQLPLFFTDETVLDWKRDHPLLRGLNIGRLFIAESMRLSLPPEAEIVIEGRQGPLAALYRADRRTHLVVGFDLLQSNWPLRETFPYFLFNTLQFLAASSELNLRESFQPGDAPRLPRSAIARIKPTTEALTLLGPDGPTRIRVNAAETASATTADLTLPVFARVGLYRTEPEVPGYERIAVNLLDETESDILPSNTPPGSVGTAVAVSGEEQKQRQEWWWWLIAVGALPLLMIEWWIYTRRLHA